MIARLHLILLLILVLPFGCLGAGKEYELFSRTNLVAWCIVPFDAKKRAPEERAAMLERMGIRHFAYDYRAEHVPTFDAEMDALQKHKIKLTAWWFPTTLNAEARKILDVLKRHNLQTELWVMGGGAPTKTPEEQKARILAEANRIRPIAEEAAKIGCKVALYNHGGWFGEPENQIGIIQQLNLPNVGIVYNLHHGHEHLARFPELLEKMKPYLLALNLNGMEKGPEKIIPIGQGSLDLELLKTIVASRWHGPIGILNHTDEDAEARLLDNLEGLEWLVAKLEGHPAGEQPKPRSWTKPARSASSMNWVEPMKQVHAKFTGKAGTLAQFGDSITVTMAYWAPLTYGPKNLPPEGATALSTVKKHLAPECWARWKGPDYGNNGSMTISWALENVDKWLKSRNPETTLIMFGSNDVGVMDATEYETKTREVVRRCLANGTVVILSTPPPRHGYMEKSKLFAEAIRKIAVQEKLPLIDYQAEILKRRPDDWDGALPQFKNSPGDEYQVPTLIAKDGVHPSNFKAHENDFSEEGLRTNGFVLRNYLSLLAYAEVVLMVFGGT